VRAIFTADEQLHERVPARPESIGPLRRAVLRFAADNGTSVCHRDDIALAVREAFGSAVLPAYVGTTIPAPSRSTPGMQERSLEVLICDKGNGMLPRTDSTDSPAWVSGVRSSTASPRRCGPAYACA
jgi:anti-sigma regulatory factor (Ser/Thr protein kinase)